MLQVADLHVRLGRDMILDGVTFDVHPSETVAVLGPSGGGKTTLLRVIAGLQKADRGSVRWNGETLDDVPPHARGFGLMFQDYALFPHLDVGQNVAFGLRMQHRPAIDKRVAEVLDWVGLSGYARRRVTALSGGEQQRVALARALAPAPRLLMLDEPVGSLDRTLRDRIVPELRDLFTTRGITSLYVTHDQEEAFTVADRIVILNAGRIAQIGAPEDVWRHPASEWVAGFLGFTNASDGTVAGGVASTVWGRLRLPDAHPGTYRIVVRPDSVRLGGDLPATVETRAFRGGHYQVRLRTDSGAALEAEIDDAPPPGTGVGLTIDPDGVMLFSAPDR